MKLAQQELHIATRGKTLLDISDRIATVVADSRVTTGLCTVFVQHTSASLVIQENADPRVRSDLEAWFSDLAPESRKWIHDDEGKDDMPAHARSTLTRTSETIPIRRGRLALGTWQGLYLWEHRDSPHDRRLVVTVLGE